MMNSNQDEVLRQNWDLKAGYKPMQWRSTISAPLCALCNKIVYPAEEVNGAGQKYHKLCLKCTACNNLLNSGNLNEHEKKIYCVPCYRRHFGPQGVSRSLGTALPSDIETPPSSPSLNRKEINFDHHRYQRKASTNSSLSHTSSDDDSRYTTSGLSTQTSYRPSSINLPAFKAMTIPENICPRCSKTVYSAEEIKAIGKSFHKRCYTCAHCKGNINGGRYCEHDGELYDNNCYQRLFGPKGTLSLGK